MTSTGKTVLVVDDEESLRAMVVKLIETRGHAVLTASSGADTQAIVKSGMKIDLLVLDVVMPGLNGFEALESIRQLGHRFPVIMLTSKTRDADLMGAYEKGADYYVTKPLQPSQLLNIVDFLIGDLPTDDRAHLESML